MSSWEIWRFAQGLEVERGEIIEVLEFDDDHDAAQQKYAELQKDAEMKGGCFELRRDGVYVSFYSCLPPLKREGED